MLSKNLRAFGTWYHNVFQLFIIFHELLTSQFSKLKFSLFIQFKTSRGDEKLEANNCRVAALQGYSFASISIFHFLFLDNIKLRIDVFVKLLCDFQLFSVHFRRRAAGDETAESGKRQRERKIIIVRRNGVWIFAFSLQH